MVPYSFGVNKYRFGTILHKPNLHTIKAFEYDLIKSLTFSE